MRAAYGATELKAPVPPPQLIHPIQPRHLLWYARFLGTRRRALAARSATAALRRRHSDQLTDFPRPFGRGLLDHRTFRHLPSKPTKQRYLRGYARRRSAVNGTSVRRSPSAVDPSAFPRTRSEGAEPVRGTSARSDQEAFAGPGSARLGRRTSAVVGLDRAGTSRRPTSRACSIRPADHPTAAELRTMRSSSNRCSLEAGRLLIGLDQRSPSRIERGRVVVTPPYKDVAVLVWMILSSSAAE